MIFCYIPTYRFKYLNLEVEMLNLVTKVKLMINYLHKWGTFNKKHSLKINIECREIYVMC